MEKNTITANQTALAITEDAAAARWSVSVFTIRNLRYKGKLRATSINGRAVRYIVADLDAYFMGNASGGSDGSAPVKGVCGVWRSKRAKRPAANSATVAA